MKHVTLPTLNSEANCTVARALLVTQGCYTHSEACALLVAFLDNEPEAFEEILSGTVKTATFAQDNRPSGERIWTLRVAACIDFTFRSEPFYACCPCCGDEFGSDGRCAGCEAVIDTVPFTDPDPLTERSPVIVSPSIPASEIELGDEIVVCGYAAEVVQIAADDDDPRRLAFEIEGSDPYCPGDKYEPSYTRRFFRDQAIAVTPATFSVFEERRANRVADAIVALGMWADFPRLNLIERAARRLARRNGTHRPASY